MAYVSYEYYQAYGGDLVQESDFAKYEAAAERLINAVMRYQVNADNFPTLHESIQTAIKNAVCAQMEYYGNVGLEASSVGVSNASFTVGKVSVTNVAADGAAIIALAPAAKLYLEQTGLMNRDVCVPVEPFVPYWW